MGDRPSETIASLALRKTAEMKREEFPKECNVILNSSYMDDIIDSTDTVENAQKITENITNILKSADFHVKQWVISPGHNNVADIELINFLDSAERVLGMSWMVHDDYFKDVVNLNFSKKTGNVRSESDLSIENFDYKIPLILTKRMLLSQVNGIYDPLGLISPFIIKGKILLRLLWITDSKLGWDDKIPEEMRLKWNIYFKEMFELSSLLFNRSVKPVNALKTSKRSKKSE